MLNLKIGICDDDMIYCNDIASQLDRYMMTYDVNISYQIYIHASDIVRFMILPVI